MKKALLLALAMAIASLALVACGGSDGDDTAAGADTQAEGTTEAGGESGGEAEGGTAGSGDVIDFETPAGSDLAYTTDSATAEAGEATINLTNVQSIPHDVSIEDESGESIAQTDTISEDSASVKVKLEPGTYTFYCSVPGHREAGMEGTLTVE